MMADGQLDRLVQAGWPASVHVIGKDISFSRGVLACHVALQDCLCPKGFWSWLPDP